ncbi:MAG: HAMP domain-containing histidine kinase [Proteobacteria bacterium]|nr:HAMP domain-containing histidine kinase [Pseudomonadota bacterium]
MSELSSPLPTVEPDRGRWMEAMAFQTLLDGQRASRVPMLMGVVIMCTLVFDGAPGGLLAAWLGLATVMVVLRWRVLARYEEVREHALAERHRFKRGLTWLWPLNAFTWGVTPLLFHGRMSREAEMVCWLMLAWGTAVAMVWLAAHPRIARNYLVTLLCTLLASVLIGRVFWVGVAPIWIDVGLPAVVMLYGLLLQGTARGLGRWYHEGYELRYSNAVLIESLQRQTRVAQEMARFKERFLTNAAHDLKQPVHALGIYAEWLSEEPERARELGPKILQSTQAIHTLFDSLFDLARLETGRFELAPRTVEMADLMTGLAVQFEPMARQKGLRLHLRTVDVRLHTDPIMLRRILGNLIANALRYTERGGVLLAARRRRDGIHLEVWDTGAGLAPAEQTLIFEEFYKVPKSGTQEGFGLGLAIVRLLADRLGYPVSVYSVAGRGSVFKIVATSLPAEPAELRDSADRSGAQSAGSGFGSLPPDV